MSKKFLKFIFTYPYQVSKTSNRKRNISPVIKNLPLTKSNLAHAFVIPFHAYGGYVVNLVISSLRKRVILLWKMYEEFQADTIFNFCNKLLFLFTQAQCKKNWILRNQWLTFYLQLLLFVFLKQRKQDRYIIGVLFQTSNNIQRTSAIKTTCKVTSKPESTHI